MKYRRLVLALVLLAACNPVTVVPIDDEDAGEDGGTEASPPANDAGPDVPTNDAADG